MRAFYVLPYALKWDVRYTYDQSGVGAHLYVGGSFATLGNGTTVNSVADLFISNDPTTINLAFSAVRNNPNSSAVGVTGGDVFSITVASSCLFFSGSFTALGDGTATQSIATLAIKVFSRSQSEWRSAFPTSGFFLSALPAYPRPPPSLPSPPSAIYLPNTRYLPPTYYTSLGLTGRDGNFEGGRVALGGLFSPEFSNASLIGDVYNNLAFLVQSNDADAGMVEDPITTWPFYNRDISNRGELPPGFGVLS